MTGGVNVDLTSVLCGVAITLLAETMVLIRKTEQLRRRVRRMREEDTVLSPEG